VSPRHHWQLRVRRRDADVPTDPNRPDANDAARRTRRRRRELLDRARLLTPYVAAVNQGLVFLVPTSSDGQLFVKGEVSEFRILDRAFSILRDARLHPKAPTIVDVPAHVGTTTLAALAHHGFARAVAIEPDTTPRPARR
jgi:hypothetical protein